MRPAGTCAHCKAKIRWCGCAFAPFRSWLHDRTGLHACWPPSRRTYAEPVASPQPSVGLMQLTPRVQITPRGLGPGGYATVSRAASGSRAVTDSAVTRSGLIPTGAPRG